jgi:serine protease Do
VGIQDVSPEIARAIGLDKPGGAMVTSVYPGDPAYRAGLRKGDVILKINDKDIEDPRALTRLVGSLKPEDKVSMVIWRESKMIPIRATLGKRSDERVASIEKSPYDIQGKIKDRLGLILQDITPDAQRQLNLEDAYGAIVMDIDPSGSAANSKIQRMDVIKEVRGLNVKNVREYLSAISQVGKGQTVLMLVIRNSKPLYIAVDTQ